MENHTLYVNGHVHTMDPDAPYATAFLVDRGRIMAVGTDADVRAQAVGAEEVDLEGRTVIPGMTDAHTHLVWASDTLRFWTSVHSPPHTDIRRLLDALRVTAAKTAPGEWVIGMGNLLHEKRLDEGRYPTRWELDSVSTEHPVLIRLAGHVHVLNSMAIEQMGIPEDVVAPEQAYIGRTEEGLLDGVFLDAQAVLTLPTFPDEERRAAIPEAARHYFLRYGITAVGDIVFNNSDIPVLQRLKNEGKLPLRIGLYPVIADAMSAGVARDHLPATGFGNDSLFLAGIKVFADGGVSAKRGAMYEPYPGTDTCGGLAWSKEELGDIVRTAIEKRTQVITHAAGDRSFDLVLDVYEEELARTPWEDHRFRVEHVSHPYLTDERIERLRRSGTIGVGQAAHFYSMGDFWGELLGEKTLPLALRQRSMIDAGLTIPGSSDLTGSQPESSNPFLGMWTSTQHQAVFGARYGTDESITAVEALKAFTMDSAHAIGQDHIRGSITPGKLADFAVLDRDLLAIPTEELRDVEVLKTYIDGDLVYDAEAAS